VSVAAPPKEEAAEVRGAERPPAWPGAFQRRARATLLWGAAALVVAQATMRVGIDSWWPELRDPTFEIKGRQLDRVRAASPGPPVTVVALGSSVMRNAFEGAYLEGLLGRELGRPAAAVNMASLGAGPLTELVWARRLVVDRGVRPDFVCVEVSPTMYSSPGHPPDVTRFPDHLLSRRDLEVVRRYSPDPRLAQTWHRFHWFPAYAHRLTILGYLSESLVPAEDRVPTWGDSLDDRFWSARPPLPPAELRRVLAEVRAIYEPQLRDFAPGRSSLQALEELLALLSGEHIPAAVVLAPEGPMLRGLYPKGPLGAFVRQVTELSRRHGLAFVDAFAWLGEDEFVDSVHPNVVGADAFSTRLAREVLLPALANRP
jgi:hypothetical protein